jgi:hypothetical protein
MCTVKKKIVDSMCVLLKIIHNRVTVHVPMNANSFHVFISRGIILTMQAVLQMSAGVPYPAPKSTSRQRYCLVWMSSVKWWYCNKHIAL